MEKSIDDDTISIKNTDQLVFDENQPKIITFECDELIIKEKNIETKWPDGLPLNFEKYDTIVFSGNNKKYTYKKV